MARATTPLVPVRRRSPGRERAAPLPIEERRRAIVAATLPLVRERGREVTTREIAEAAGVAEGTIFRVFADKDALLDAVIEAAFDPAPLDAALAAVDVDQPWEARLVAMVGVLHEWTRGVWRLISAVGPPRRARRPKGARLPGLAALEALFRAPDAPALRMAPETAAVRLRALAVATGHPALVGDHVTTAEEVVELFLDGARRSPRGRGVDHGSRPARSAGRAER